MYGTGQPTAGRGLNSGGLAAVTPFSSHDARRVMLDPVHRIRFRTGSTEPL